MANRRYGYRRITALLGREGRPVNHKRVLRVMREDNLLCLRLRPFVPRTTDSRHGWRAVPNLARGMQPTGCDQLWVADITYLHLAEEFAYLAVVLDAFSRRVIGWSLDTHLRAERLTRDDLTDLALLRLDAMVAILVDDHGLPDKVDYASLQPPDSTGDGVTHHDLVSPSLLDFDFQEWIEELEGRFGEAQKTVAVDGKPAYVNFVSPGQINIQVPADVAVGGSVPVVVRANGVSTTPMMLEIRSAAGGILAPASFRVGDRQFVAATHQDGSFISNGQIANVPASPAKPGEMITFYGVGFGAVNPSGIPYSGQIVDGIIGNDAVEPGKRLGKRDIVRGRGA